MLGLGKAKKDNKKKKQEELIAKQVLQQEDFEYLEEQLTQEKLLSELELKNKGSVDFEQMLGKFKTEISPTWIISHQGKDYVYEGINNPSKLFTGKGELRENLSPVAGIKNKPEDVIIREKVRGVGFYREKPERSPEERLQKRDFGKDSPGQNVLWDAALFE